MTKPIGRREFLKKSLFGIGSLMLASSLKAVENTTKFFASPDVPPATLDPAALMESYRQAKEYFYQQQYSEAISLFTQLIDNNPTALFLYDGLARVYGAEQNLYAAAELFKRGAAANPSNSLFLHRYSISLRNLCLGNPSKAHSYAVQYNISNLYDFAAQQLISANSLNPKSVYQLDLKDFPRLLARYNSNYRNSLSPVILSENTLSLIEAATVFVSTKWTTTRASRQPSIPSEESYGNSNGSSNLNMGGRGRGNNGHNGSGHSGHGRRHRHLHSQQEQQERENSQRKSKKRVLYSYMRKNSHTNNTAKVERWGMQILGDDIKDTNSVGYMRRYFKRHNSGDRVISLNRYFYNNTDNIYASLALAASLAKYKSDTSSLNEAKELLSSANQYLNSLTQIGSGAYYITLAKIKIKENNKSGARSVLIDGAEKMDGKGGVAYSIMENYAASFGNADKAKAINIQKALCNKQVAEINDPLWIWVEKYRQFLSENQINTTEQIKALTALAKLQQRFNDSGHSATVNEINALKNSML